MSSNIIDNPVLSGTEKDLISSVDNEHCALTSGSANAKRQTFHHGK
jgi:hypothetical protein